MDAALALAQNAVGMTYEKLPREAVEATKKDILDTLGTALAGSGAAGCAEIVELARAWGGKEEATVLVYGDKVPAVNAAMANGTMAHALDFDDTHDAAILHGGVVVIPAALAVAEEKGGVAGKELIAAVALGIDLMARMGLAIRRGPGETGWIYTPILGFFGAAMAAGKLYGLDEEGMLNALGIAYAQSAGNNQCVPDGALTKRLQAGLAARGGILAAQLARKGFTGAKNIIGGKYGFYKVYLHGDYDPTPIIAGLGERLEVANLSFKPYPCCRAAHGAIDATLDLVRQYDLRPNNVREIMVRVSKGPYELVCDPLEVKRNPRGVVDAQFSIPYGVATAIAKRKVFVDDFIPEAIRNPEVIGLANLVSALVDPEIEGSAAKTFTTIVEIKTKDGRVLGKRVEALKGDPKNPMSMAEIAQKFRDCANFSAKPLAAEKAQAVVEIVSHLEEAEDATEIVRLLA